jgi:hypothetical protein
MTKQKKHISRGDYGYARKYKNTKLVLTLLLFLCIVTDVVMALILYQTKNTILTVVACVMSLPFAKVFIAYLLCIKFDPLNKTDHARVEALSKQYGVKMLYDISISQTEGILFYPALTVYNNNILAFVPKATDAARVKEYTEYMKKSYEGTKYKMRVVITCDLDRFEKELAKLHEPKKEQIQIDRRVRERLLELGV